MYDVLIKAAHHAESLRTEFLFTRLEITTSGLNIRMTMTTEAGPLRVAKETVAWCELENLVFPLETIVDKMNRMRQEFK